jgi:hypothetical protein
MKVFTDVAGALLVEGEYLGLAALRREQCDMNSGTGRGDHY